MWTTAQPTHYCVANSIIILSKKSKNEETFKILYARAPYDTRAQFIANTNIKPFLNSNIIDKSTTAFEFCCLMMIIKWNHLYPIQCFVCIVYMHRYLSLTHSFVRSMSLCLWMCFIGRLRISSIVIGRDRCFDVCVCMRTTYVMGPIRRIIIYQTRPNAVDLFVCYFVISFQRSYSSSHNYIFYDWIYSDSRPNQDRNASHREQKRKSKR